MTPAKISQTTAVLLHFKLLGDFLARAQEEALRKEHAANAKHYSNYAKTLATLGNQPYMTAESVKYLSPKQLLDLGLIRLGDSYVR